MIQLGRQREKERKRQRERQRERESDREREGNKGREGERDVRRNPYQQKSLATQQRPDDFIICNQCLLVSSVSGAGSHLVPQRTGLPEICDLWRRSEMETGHG